MKKNIFRVLGFVLAAAMVLPMQACGKKDELTTVTTKEEVKEMTDTFYAGLTEADPISMTSYAGGEKTSVLVIDGDKMHIDDDASGSSFYLFKENGKNWFMNEGEQPVKEDVMYDLYKNMVETNVMIFVNGYFEADTDNQFKYSSTLSAKTDTSTLVTDITGEQDGEEQTIRITGTKSDSKVRSITVSQVEKEMFRFEFAYDVKVDLPEHTLVDPSASYKHVDSPYASVSDILAAFENEEDFQYVAYGDEILICTEKDGRQLQLVAPLGDQADAYNALDVLDEDYQKKTLDIIRTLDITDCVDFTDALIPESELAVLTGKTVSEAVEAGFAGSGWAITDNAYATLEKDGFEYTALVTLPEGFDVEADHDFEDLNDAVIQEVHFSAPTLSVLPMK